MPPACLQSPVGLALLAEAKRLSTSPDIRLILADWLEEQGESEVAALMRLSLSSRAWMPFPQSVQTRWTPFNICRSGWLGIQITRGVVYLPHTPWLSALRICGKLELPQLEQIAEIGEATQLLFLACETSGLADDGLQRLGQLESLSYLDGLDITDNGITDRGIERWLASPTRPRLTEWVLCRNLLTGAAARLIAHSPLADHLIRLDFKDNALGASGAVALTRSPRLQRLEWLRLSNNAIGDVGAIAFSVSSYLPRLRELYLRDNGLRQIGMSVLERLRNRGVRVDS
ncbi:hypothetical protein [Tuwongella immobilis]|uniref:Repeat-companion domain protein n=1 Tax=Tuwongella immobilis TaxID=692036 RepID=A0A6C2YKH6_9BACT|nr:hypothetical protein [Tuwongella immobilis]VIP01615.1 Leucine-rich repeat-containing protein typical subtype OS=Herpetosiphon aurantiacus (strain ATCC 23779 / DSM 785) GN=Haur_4051 PE=4 SV=1: LRR_6: LRR_1 [Tuwongella immobilis]VTR98934.1 Leucine-rich repeat-containing protein typical subtype OS=Herpetosiphon aurantiacus (strain ATCC 23779 / DSM 785) GN=Haur_4051 PE=4 SV=1: LRR_6: LRR_1 [Tuwongella immobilis]